MIGTWISYLLRRSAEAGTAAAIPLLLAEALVPGSVLPFFRLHAFLIAVVALHVAVVALPEPEPEHPFRRAAVSIPIVVSLATAIWVALGDEGTSSFLLSAAATVLIVACAAAMMRPYAKHRTVQENH